MTEEKKYCPKCGAELKGDAKICLICGTPIEDPEQTRKAAGSDDGSAGGHWNDRWQNTQPYRDGWNASPGGQNGSRDGSPGGQNGNWNGSPGSQGGSWNSGGGQGGWNASPGGQSSGWNNGGGQGGMYGGGWQEGLNRWQEPPGAGKANNSLIFGILACVCVLFSFTVVGGIAGIVLGILGIHQASAAKRMGNVSGTRTAGLVTGIIGLTLNIICLVVIAMVILNVFGYSLPNLDFFHHSHMLPL
ncbi:MAG: zinc-ribbon domain-containing protein [Anaerovoracaceae bacterium]|jgi:hypothetical protein